jgi:hypothetical protein
LKVSILQPLRSTRTTSAFHPPMLSYKHERTARSVRLRPPALDPWHCCSPASVLETSRLMKCYYTAKVVKMHFKFRGTEQWDGWGHVAAPATMCRTPPRKMKSDSAQLSQGLGLAPAQ